MLPWLFFAILLGFPLLELGVALLLAQKIGWWLLLWFIATTLLGMTLMRGARFALVGRVMGALQQGQDPFRAIFSAGRYILAGVLLILPGVISDVIALLILIWPRRAPKAPAKKRTDVIEGEYRRED
jgi:UPF0716 protein FxsA